MKQSEQQTKRNPEWDVIIIGGERAAFELHLMLPADTKLF
jgi:hypothetical protein